MSEAGWGGWERLNEGGVKVREKWEKNQQCTDSKSWVCPTHWGAAILYGRGNAASVPRGKSGFPCDLSAVKAELRFLLQEKTPLVTQLSWRMFLLSICINPNIIPHLHWGELQILFPSLQGDAI